MKQNAPKSFTLIFAVVIAVVALVAWLASVFGYTIPCVSVYAFWGLAIAFVLLLCGCLVEGL